MIAPDGGAAWNESGVFDETECATFRLATPADPGVYAWEFSYAGEPIPAANTPFRDTAGCGVTAVTVVEAAQPALENTLYRPGSLAFGVDQFSAEAEGCR